MWRRAPRAVYRVYDEEEFLEDPGRELEMQDGTRPMLVGVAGGVVLLAGVVGIAMALLASGRRTPLRGEVRQAEGGRRDLAAVASRHVHGTRGLRRTDGQGVHLLASTARIRRGTRAVLLHGSPRQRRRRAAPLPRRAPGASVARIPSEGRVIAVADPPPEAAVSPEFGFER